MRARVDLLLQRCVAEARVGTCNEVPEPIFRAEGFAGGVPWGAEESSEVLSPGPISLLLIPVAGIGFR
eukprot:14351524-Alexandrium_andersonii.AAC.1